MNEACVLICCLSRVMPKSLAGVEKDLVGENSHLNFKTSGL